ncbi:type VI secretion system Vgr family protein [Chthoniobacter flavus Ellin428]|uniref:Type VI secretion system Vgr family protein n=1 Tax=Chthoniobacter flavus Ellin428 TaxID=497964 RepID=B4D1Q5_9BACT|nr:type VI secretion system tip protein TssI/VgrG [Chthoniobacter flavus]EDY19667.1 type VI secretion system Vgr family protein [Chthoniobacter flavus Ellin428]TCO92903.1 type VI secretion system secreted protein VgrG [Chthoniobacter flavus]
MALSQNARIAKLSTPLGKDVLVLNRVVISEQLSQPFRIEADLLSEKKDVKFEDIIGQSVTITIATHGDVPRYYNGIVSRFTQMGMESRFEAYRMEVVPKLWVLSRTYQCRIFQNLSVPDILRKVLKDVEVEWSTTGSYDPRDYCVQYRETDLNFVSRLMEEEGMHYFFKFSDGQHKMVIADNAGAHEVLLGHYSTIDYRPYTGRPTGDEFIYDWAEDKVLLPATYTHTDYDFEMPKKNLLTRSQQTRQHAEGDGEWYDFPGLHTSTGLGDRRARVRCEEMLARYDMAKGKADARGLQVGFAFTLADHPRKDQDVKHLVTSAVHTIQLDALESGDTDRGTPYHCSFATIPASVTYRPQRIAPKPFVQGPQTAIVVGPAGEEIYTDKYGRVKVQFHWDRDGKFDQNSSCWIRVSQIWAGKSWGGMTIPRIGQEVVVDFLEGDPDQPLVVGRVYNGESMPPWGLPGQKVVSGVKTNSTPGGGGYNEFSMDDTKGTEKITTHAQKDMNTTVENDKTLTVLHDRTSTIANNDTEKVGVNQSITIGEAQTITIGTEQSEKIGAARSTTIGAEDTLSVGAARSTEIGAEDSLTVGAAHTVEAGAEIGITAGAAVEVTAGAEMALTAGAALEVTAGAEMAITAGAAIEITAGMAVTITSAVSIAITAPAILLNGRPVAPMPPGVPIL